MKRMIPIVLAILAVSASAFAQAPDQAAIDKALLAAPGNLKAGATVIKWKSDFTYDTLKKGTSNLVCYDKSGQPNQQPFMVECTSMGNLNRAAQNMKFEAMGDKAKGTGGIGCRREGRNPSETRVRIGMVPLDGSRRGARSSAHDDRRAGRYHTVARIARQ